MPVADFFAIKGATVDILRDSLTDFAVTWGFTNRNPPRLWCYIGRLHWPDGEWATNRAREYRVSIPIVLNAIRVRTTTEDAEAWLAAQVQQVVAAFGPASPMRQTGAVSWNLVPKDFGSQPHADGIEVQAALDLQVTYRP